MPSTVRRANLDEAPHAEAATPRNLSQGQQLDDYIILREIGQGGVATVYLARQISLDRDVALKVSQVSGAEGKTLARLDHPNIVRIYSDSVSQNTGLRLTAVEYVAGISLGDFLRSCHEITAEGLSGPKWMSVPTDEPRKSTSPLSELNPVGVLLYLGLKLCEALAHAHAKAVIHLDVKPDNILLDGNGIPKLADFNVASLETLLQTGNPSTFGGTPAFASPEQERALNSGNKDDFKGLSFSTDIYSAGRVLIEVGKRTLPAAEALSLKKFSDDKKWENPRDFSTSFGQLQTILSQMLEPDSTKRPSAKNLVQEFQAALAFSKLQAKPVSLLNFKLFIVSISGTLLALPFSLLSQNHSHLLKPPRQYSIRFTLFVILPLALLFCGWRNRKLLKELNFLKTFAQNADQYRTAADRLRKKVILLPFSRALICLMVWLCVSPGYDAALGVTTLSPLATALTIVFMPLAFLSTVLTFSRTLYWIQNQVLPILWAGDLNLTERIENDRKLFAKTVSRFRDITVSLPIIFSIGLWFRIASDFNLEMFVSFAARQVEFLMLVAFQVYDSTRVLGAVEAFFGRYRHPEVTN